MTSSSRVSSRILGYLEHFISSQVHPTESAIHLLSLPFPLLHKPLAQARALMLRPFIIHIHHIRCHHPS